MAPASSDSSGSANKGRKGPLQLQVLRSSLGGKLSDAFGVEAHTAVFLQGPHRPANQRPRQPK